MAYDLSSLITSVRKRAKDTTFDSTLITDFIQSTQSEVLGRSRFPFMEETDTDSVNEGDTDYQLYSDVEVILSLHLVDANDLVVRPGYLGYPEFYERYDPETASKSSPLRYTVFGNTVMWNAPLDRNYTVHIKYLKSPSILSLDSDVPSIPERFKEILIRGALAGVEEYRGNFDLASIHLRKVEELTEDMLSRLSLRQLATPHRASFGRKRAVDDAWGY